MKVTSKQKSSVAWLRSMTKGRIFELPCKDSLPVILRLSRRFWSSSRDRPPQISEITLLSFGEVFVSIYSIHCLRIEDNACASQNRINEPYLLLFQTGLWTRPIDLSCEINVD